MPREFAREESIKLPPIDNNDLGEILSGMEQPTLLKFTDIHGKKMAAPFEGRVSDSGVEVMIKRSGEDPEQLTFQYGAIHAVGLYESVLAEKDDYYLVNSIPPSGVKDPEDAPSTRMVKKHPKLGIRNPVTDPIVAESLELLKRDLPKKSMAMSLGKSGKEFPEGCSPVNVTVDALSGKIMGLEKPSARLGEMENQHQLAFGMRHDLVEGINNLDDQGVAGPLMDSKARQRVEDTVFFFNQEMLAAREGGGGKTETLYPDPKPVKPWWRKFI